MRYFLVLFLVPFSVYCQDLSGLDDIEDSYNTPINLASTALNFDGTLIDLDLGYHEVKIERGQTNKFWCIQAKIQFYHFDDRNTPGSISQAEIESRIGTFWVTVNNPPNNINSFKYPLNGQQLTAFFTDVFGGKGINAEFNVHYILKGTDPTLPGINKIEYKVEFQTLQDCNCLQ